MKHTKLKIFIIVALVFITVAIIADLVFNQDIYIALIVGTAVVYTIITHKLNKDIATSK